PRVREPEPEVPLSELGRAIKAALDVPAQREELVAARQANREKFRRAETAFDAEERRINDREWELNALEARGNEARRVVCRSIPPSNEEINEGELGKASLRKVGQLSSRHQIFEAVVPPPGETPEGKELNRIIEEIASTEADVRRLD